MTGTTEPGDGRDASALLVCEDGLPRLKPDAVEVILADHAVGAEGFGAVTEACRRWLAELGQALGGGYEVAESEHFLALTASRDGLARPLLQAAEEYRAGLLSGLEGVADFTGPGKEVVIVFRSADDYYRYIAAYFPEGRHGGSVGVHIRQGFPHVVVYGRKWWVVQATLAHELTHAGLCRLGMPQWLEEGLARAAECRLAARQQLVLTGRSVSRHKLVLTGRSVSRHKRYWASQGLHGFWAGEAFSKQGKVQGLAYELAEVLALLLFEEGRPRWLGWDTGPGAD